ncbi:LamG-like jellyroll fold domain-containing protein [Singulisphaera sp. Ch08]|uniref:LamG-like jellyroll fold domain-containing protein n=1 Tax=Singulisphaera sp. Ch08 TaxID=3120278 RepID=A0AAU7CCR0_9BACT
MSRTLTLVTVLLVGSLTRPSFAEDAGLIGHWKLAGDAKDSSGRGNHGESVGVDFGSSGPGGQANSAVKFDGRKSYIRVPANPSLNLGTNDFTFAVWAHTDERIDDVLGDLVSKYDPAARRGLNWCIKNGAGTTSSQSNYRNIQFGIDSGSRPTWTDQGRPGNAVYVMAMAVHNGQLFVGTCEGGNEEAGHVYRYDGGTRWVDCGSPDRSNAVTSLAAYGGKLYAGTGRYRLAGSSLTESKNANVGGKVLCYDGDGSWTDCGQLPKTEAVGGMAVFQGELYASSLYKPAGFFRYQGGREWVACPLPRDGERVVALGVYNGHVYATSYDACAVYRFDGSSWESLGKLETSGQTYSFEVWNGELFVGTWPNGQVFRYDGERQWVTAGRLGGELEVMGMAVHNGKLYGGTLPLAEVHRYDGGVTWANTGQLDRTPDVRYRRAWSMALFQGRLFCGTLPSGRVHGLEVGENVSYDHELKPGWRHLAAIRESGRLKLFVDGKPVADSTPSNPVDLDLTNDEPLKIGLGMHDYFKGSLSDLRLYGRALKANEVSELAARPAKGERP